MAGKQNCRRDSDLVFGFDARRVRLDSLAVTIMDDVLKKILLESRSSPFDVFRVEYGLCPDQVLDLAFRHHPLDFRGRAHSPLRAEQEGGVRLTCEAGSQELNLTPHSGGAPPATSAASTKLIDGIGDEGRCAS